MRRSITAIVFVIMMLLALSVGGATPVQADPPVPIHLGSGSITSTSLATYGTTWGPANDYWFDLSAGIKVTIYGLDMSQVPYTGLWGWPPVAGEDGGNAQLWVLDDHGGFSRHDLTSAGTGGTWNAQGTPVGHDQGFRKYLVQNFFTGWVEYGSSQYNIEPWKGPRLAPGPNTDGNMGTPNPASDKFDLEYTYVPGVDNYTVSGRHRMYYAASWDEMSLPKPPWPAYKWQWNKAINNTATPDAAWLPFYNGTGTVPGFCGPANLRMAFQNRGVPQSGYWTISWDDIVVENYTLGDHAGPVTSGVVAAPNPAGVGVPIALTAAIDDSTTGGSNIKSADYRIDGGAWVSMSALDGAFDGVSEGVSANLPGFSEAGVYNISVRGTDSNCNLGPEESVLLAVYDPAAGFVTGGGWIWSPAGAYDADHSLEGKATFGFVSKYKKGASVPDGNTEFQFKAGDLNFHSTSYDWLVVAGARAQYKGTGTINGTGDYRFMLTAIDGQVNGGGGVDKFRIKIWGDSGLIYDNQLGAGDTEDPTTVLGGGSIVIHK
jgi:hypothetical protein